MDYQRKITESEYLRKLEEVGLSSDIENEGDLFTDSDVDYSAESESETDELLEISEAEDDTKLR